MGEGTRIMDVDEEQLLRHFCLEQECREIIDWFAKQGFERSDDFDERLALGGRLKDMGNDQFRKADFHGAMMHALGALHCLDFSRACQILQEDHQKRQVNEGLVPVLSNLSTIFMKRGDAYNSARAADLGIEYVKRLKDAGALHAKLLFRRASAKHLSRDFEVALGDLREAARLMPTDKSIRRLLETCKLAVQDQRGTPDDKWRGLFTDSPVQAQRSARCTRWCKLTRVAAMELWRCVADPANRKVTAMLCLGPVVTTLVAAFVARSADSGRAAPLDAQ
mmetsp:Transcript_90239/g.254630  ORF Transcript_90239/g.254630 Transcript_90239/m.254630 type:complete len:279 (-) Transcript_90239:17-853(-)